MHTDPPAAGAAQLLDRYLISLDDDKLDDAWARDLFTEDAVVEFPMSRHAGRAGMADWHRESLAAFAGTQHLGSPAVVDPLGPDRVGLRANLVSTHVHHPGAAREPLFATGTFVTGEARRTPAGWRLSALAFRVVWMTGSPPGGPA
ncbi:nuclear transport factor 2 family protein [Actinacidiphila guanduensis]|uniref:SnoaL-like domain-containing protein n=1 Tax=Actinacidiphila guanduensis TaxID=310781 RepID=A0A1H0H016_9ACTN|nr:nuclear transport factor 2 family protein [Actinacidiphila guanduensis]SDO12606.1 SnoaL-like domain-containing protein [Actinacidiphila guanduensis]